MQTTRMSSQSKSETTLSMQHLTISDGESEPVSEIMAGLVSSYNDRIRPLLDVIDALRRLRIASEGIHLPTIVVIGNQSAGKSSVLESLAGISLPRGQGICTRVPLIMRLKQSATPKPEMYLEFLDKSVSTDEDKVAEAIENATDEIAGAQKGISNTPLTLVVKKNGVPDLTMVDLPGITRVPVAGQPEDIYEQISAIIMEYIRPEESIILNVLSATDDFPTCESIVMSQKVDKTGERTLAVVTKVDKAPEGLLEKVTADEVNIGLGYVCVRNRIGDESYEEARVVERSLFEYHPLLSKINKSMAGIPVLAQILVRIQATIITRQLPAIVKKVDEKLQFNLSELNKLPQKLTSVAEAVTCFMRILGLAKDSLRKILLRGEFDEYPDDNRMHCTARLAEMINEFAADLQSDCGRTGSEGGFLMEEIMVLEELKGVSLPNFLPRSAFPAIFQKKVNAISHAPVDFISKVWNYVEGVSVSVLMHHSEKYPQLQSLTRRAAQNLVAKMKENSASRVAELIEMERISNYTCSPEYTSKCSELMASETSIVERVKYDSRYNYNPSTISLPCFGEIKVGHLTKYQHAIPSAFDLKVRMTSYWTLMLRRLVDCMALHLLHSLHKLVNEKMEVEIIGEIMAVPNGGKSGIERMLEESPAVAAKREQLSKSIKTLQDSKDVVLNIMDRIASSVE